MFPGYWTSKRRVRARLKKTAGKIWNLLTPQDEVKFVLCGEEDYLWAKQVLSEKRVADRCPVLLSAVQGQLEPAQLAEWILRDNLPVRLQIQLHKLLWGEGRGKISPE